MKKSIRRVLFLILIFSLLATSAAFAWITATDSVSFKVKMKDETHLSLSDLIGDNNPIGLATSNDGLTFKDSNGSVSDEYLELTTKVLTDKNYSDLYIKDITGGIEGLKVSLTWCNSTKIFDTAEFEPTSFGFSTGTKETDMTIRVWFEGTEIDKVILDDIDLNIIFEVI